MLVCGDPVQRYLPRQKAGDDRVPIDKGLDREGVVLQYGACDAAVRKEEDASQVLIREDLPGTLFNEKARD